MWLESVRHALMIATSEFTMESLDSLIRECVAARWTYDRIAHELQRRLPSGTRGLSSRSLRRYCNANGIYRQGRLNDSDVDELVERAVYELGPSYGRRTLHGYLRAGGTVVGEQRVRRAMAAVSPAYIGERRVHSYRHFNPIPYYAEYHGHKVHIDQNEKLVRYGVTHVGAADGFSGKILNIVTMPLKNPIMIYDTLYRPMLMTHGLWDQVRVDRGTEFALILFVQNLLAAYRTNTHREPYRQTPSTQNHMIERHWVEVNNRVNYPIKRALITMEENSVIDMECPTSKYCVSSITSQLCQVGIQRHIASWNSHVIPGKGIPNELAQSNSRVATIHQSAIPDTSNVISLYETGGGGQLTIPTEFGYDPLSQFSDLRQERKLAMDRNLPTPEELFSFTVNGSHQHLADAIIYMINTTDHLIQSS